MQVLTQLKLTRKLYLAKVKFFFLWLSKLLRNTMLQIPNFVIFDVFINFCFPNYNARFFSFIVQHLGSRNFNGRMETLLIYSHAMNRHLKNLLCYCLRDWLAPNRSKRTDLKVREKEKKTRELLSLLNMKRFSLTTFPLRGTHFVSMLQSNFDKFNFKLRTKWNETKRTIENAYYCICENFFPFKNEMFENIHRQLKWIFEWMN